MERDEFNRMLQDVQRIEIAVGFQILRLATFYRDDRLHDAIWYDAKNRRVLWQENPFTPETTYHADMKAYREIVYSDPSR